MSPDSTRRKRAAAPTKPAPDGDHRKRRRNRTTQSCLNCHTSKRMCDRKRPACARCTQLGLTGLCVYEVDDPNQRVEQQDESARLLKRVAELEGVIRELKNKPSPRWTQNSPPPMSEQERWQARHSADDVHSHGSLSPNSPFVGYPTPHHTADTLSDHSLQLSYASSSPHSTPSPVVTPTEDLYRPPYIYNQSDLPQEHDMSSIFMPYPGYNDVDHGSGYAKMGNDPQNHLYDPAYGKPQQFQGSCHCGCLQDSTCYNTVLDLAVRLRKATEALSHSPRHHSNAYCPLNQRIMELDSLTSNALGNHQAVLPDERVPSATSPFTTPTDRRSSMTSTPLYASKTCTPTPCRTMPHPDMAGVSPLVQSVIRPSYAPQSIPEGSLRDESPYAASGWDNARRI